MNQKNYNQQKEVLKENLDLVVPETVVLENVHLSDSLYTLAYYISEHE